jgi:hypothetical protein
MIERCRFEEDSRQAALSGRWTPALFAHVLDCRVCGEVRFVVEALQSRGSSTPSRLSSDPAALWASGRHARRISTEAKISVIVALAQLGALAGVLAVLVQFIPRDLWSISLRAIQADAGVWIAGLTGSAIFVLAGFTWWVANLWRTDSAK